MEENVTVELCDLQSSESSNNYLSIMLKNKLRESGEIAFSMKWEFLYKITKIDITQTTPSVLGIYDVEVVHDRDLLIFGSSQQLYFFKLSTRTLQRTVTLDVKIVEIVVDGPYIYLTTGKSLVKYNLNGLLDESVDPEKALIWNHISNDITNCWGLALYRMNSKKYAFVMDYDKGISVFDSETSQTVEMTLPKIKLGYGITFTNENEMIISTSDKSVGPIQLYTFDNESQSWNLSRQALRTEMHYSPLGICYERKTKLIYVVDTYSNKIIIYNKETMEVIYQWNTNNRLYGIVIDPKKGHLYLPFVFESIQIMK